MTKVIKASDVTNHFEETINNNRQLKFKVESVVGNMLKFQGVKGRTKNEETKKWNKWKENNISYLFQVDEFFWNEVFNDLENSTKRRFSRVITGDESHTYQDLAKRKLSILKPYIGLWKGSVDMEELKTYGIPSQKWEINHPVRYNNDETMIVWQWEADSFDAHGVISYDAHTGNIFSNYHTSTGVQISAKLVASWNNKFLWERHGTSPSGLVSEKCLFDLSKPGVFRHKLMDSSLNGLPQPNGPEIILNKVIEHATVADPAHYKVEFENEYVKVLRVKYGPYEKSPLHSHSRLAGVHLTDAKARFTPKDGKGEIRNIKAGDIGLGESEIHTVENMTDKNWETILVEFKKEYPGDISELKRNATKVDPKHYKVEIENDWARIVRAKYGPNEKSVMHQHNSGVVIFLNSAKHKLINEDGSIVNADPRSGHVVWADAATHEVINLENEPTVTVFVELK
jgi:quercetin dioxygenase-like cupin family protein